MTKTSANSPVAKTSMRATNASDWASANFPLGAHLVGNVATFAIYSKHATRMVLEIFNAAIGVDASLICEMVRNPADDVWRASVESAGPGTFYGFRCWGPNWPYDLSWKRGNSSAGFVADVDASGNRYNPNKLLVDPYARELSHDRICPALRKLGHDLRIYRSGSQPYSYPTAGGSSSSVSCREFDTGSFAPKGVLLAETLNPTIRPQQPCENSLIYETHLAGLTRHPASSRLAPLLAAYTDFAAVPAIPDDQRGTYRAAARLGPYLKALGVNAVEFLPIQEFDNDENPADQSGANYWGYSTLGFFAPDRHYSYDKTPGGPTQEFKEMVDAFHRQDIEVYLDVVYNHTGEGGNLDGDADTVTITSFLGFDSAEYYAQQNSWLKDEHTKCGNELAFPSAVNRSLVLDSIKYWTETMGADGFRFDLAPVLANDPQLIADLAAYANRLQVEVIAEPWAVDIQEQGHFPSRWGEWNDHFRNVVRDFVRGSGDALQFSEVLAGDRDRFGNQGARRSINFVVAHDGFTLADLVSYDAKTNTSLAWPFGPSDGGTDDNRSSGYGQNAVIRRQQLRNFWVILAVSRGVPMMVAGDEFGRTQNGNNNPYAVDSVATWNNYAMLSSPHPQGMPTEGGGAYHDNLSLTRAPAQCNPLFVFACYVLRLRSAAQELRQRNYDGVAPSPDVIYEFHREDGISDLAGWCRSVWLRIRGAQGQNDWLVFFNLYTEQVSFVIPNDRSWGRLIDTADWAESFCNSWQVPDPITTCYGVHPLSVVMLRSI